MKDKYALPDNGGGDPIDDEGREKFGVRERASHWVLELRNGRRRLTSATAKKFSFRLFIQRKPFTAAAHENFPLSDSLSLGFVVGFVRWI